MDKKVGVKDRRSPGNCNLDSWDDNTGEKVLPEFMTCLVGKLEDGVWSAWNLGDLGEKLAWEVAEKLAAATELLRSAGRIRNPYWRDQLVGRENLAEGMGTPYRTVNTMIYAALKGLNDDVLSAPKKVELDQINLDQKRNSLSYSTDSRDSKYGLSMMFGAMILGFVISFALMSVKNRKSTSQEIQISENAPLCA